MNVDGEKKSRMAAGKKECCILCGKLTEVMQDCPVSEREHYLEGAGQLCRECYWGIYVPFHNENMIQLGKLSRTGSVLGMEGRDGRHKA